MTRKEFFRRCRQSKLLLIGGAMVLIIVLLALLAPAIIPYDEEHSNLIMKFQPLNLLAGWSNYPLGTDSLGRDILSRLLIGSRYSLMISFSAVAIASTAGTILGLLSGYFGGWVDTVIMRIGDVQIAIPQILLAIAIVAILGPNLGNLIIVLAVTGWVQYARLIRSSVMSIRGNDFVASSKVIGASDARIIVSDIFPNVLSDLIIIATQQIGQVILVEAAMSFLGLGVQAPTPSWGVMISEGRNYISTSPWTVMVPGVALMITVLAFSFFGDGLRDVLDPKMRDV